MTSTEASIELNMLPPVGPVRLRKLLEVFGTPERVLTAKRSELRAVEGIGGEVADQIAARGAIIGLSSEPNPVRDFGATGLTPPIPSSPPLLPENHPPPIHLF